VTLTLDISQDERDKAAKSGAALSDGSYPIRNAEELKAAIKLVGRSKDHSTASVKAHIIKRAKALGLTNLLPDDWKVEQERTTELNVALTMEAVNQQPSIVQEASPENGGIMKIRTPFYVGGSVARAKGFSKPILFQEKILPQIVANGMARIASGRPPLTVYARHAHADTKDHLPIGKVSALEQEGRIGYATLDVLDVKPYGEHVQALVRAGMLDAVSLRCEPGSYQLEARRVDGTPMLVCESLDVDGIDMAPDGPAQDTYGFKILTQEAVVENDVPVTENKETRVDEPLTLEVVRKENPRIIEEVERPLKEQITSLTQERDALMQEKAVVQRDKTIEEISAKAGNPTEFAAHLRQVCDDSGVRDAAGVNALLAPILLQEMERMKNSAATPTETVEQKTARLWRVGGAGHVNEGATVAAPAITQEHVLLNGTVDGGFVPED
jgi:hypothetical protein